MTRLNMRSYNAKCKRRARQTERDKSDIGMDIDLAKEFRKLNRERKKLGLAPVCLKSYGLLPDVDKCVGPTLGLSANPYDWTHDHEEDKFFAPAKCKPLRKPVSAKP